MKTKPTKAKSQNKIVRYTHGKKPKQSWITISYQSDGWIPVSKPPKKSGWYLAALKGWNVSQVVFYDMCGNDSFWLRRSELVNSSITHWQFLPKPPKTKTKKGKS